MFGFMKKKPKERPAVGIKFQQTPEFAQDFHPNPSPTSLPTTTPILQTTPAPMPSPRTPQTPPPSYNSDRSTTTSNDNAPPNEESVHDGKPAIQFTLNPEYYVTENGDGGHESDDETEEPPLNRFTRRKSVFAEAYDPEEDDDDGERIIHAKSDEQRQRLSEAVKNIFLFRSLDHDQIGEVLDAMFERRVTEGENVIKQGDDGDNFYVIESGVYNIFVKSDSDAEPRLVGKYDNSGSFGELALMYNLPRAATIQAVTSGALWAMERQTFRRILLKSACRKRKMYEALLENVPMLKTLEKYERMNLADALVPKVYAPGEQIIMQGDSADGMYFLEDGTVRIMMAKENNEEKEISRVSVGGYFGELALVTKKARAASVYAVGKAKLAFLDVEAFERLLGPCMDLMKRNIEDYENELLRIFGSKANISDIR
ncbi:cAMP-dependent protein kinase type II regulatory subunit-like isoform X1 [Homarus americanus]|uniref:cAMP-dependent protein kinase type II regulatory subunit-like isoform X1 n=1 Tax=Homarus americanus TaxID=6706 RepID=UPI001C43827E|nr:cAMP-dependent protein kinase type II regulatory subunit-like isoform X1 [Homarus americanus]